MTGLSSTPIGTGSGELAVLPRVPHNAYNIAKTTQKVTFGNLSANHFFFACGGPYASHARGGGGTPYLFLTPC
jgi:hypothetical protein